jgi:hypothetical protein
MRKNALTICCFTCACGAVGAFCRWLQNQLAFDEAGLSTDSAWNLIVPLLLIAVAVGIYFAADKFRHRGLVFSSDFYDTFTGSTKFFAPSAWVIGVIMIVAGLAVFSGENDAANAVLYRVLGGLAILSGLFFPLTASASRKRYAPGLPCLYSTLPVLQFCLWLIISYKSNSTNPTVWAYAVEILALAAALLAFYYFAGFPYGRAKPANSLYFAMLGSFLCIVTMADDRSFGLQLMFVAAICMQLFWAWAIVTHMHAPAAQEEPADSDDGLSAIQSGSVKDIIEEFHEEEQK